MASEGFLERLFARSRTGEFLAQIFKLAPAVCLLGAGFVERGGGFGGGPGQRSELLCPAAALVEKRFELRGQALVLLLDGGSLRFQAGDLPPQREPGLLRLDELVA